MRQVRESTPFRFAMRAFDARVQYQENAPIRGKVHTGHRRRDFRARPPSRVDHQAAALEQRYPDARAGAAIEEARVGSRVERQIGEATERRGDRERELSARAKPRMRGNRARDDELLGGVEAEILGDAERETRAPLALLAQNFEARGFAKLNAGLECVDGESD